MSFVNVAFGVSDPEMIKQILVKDFDSFCNRVVGKLHFWDVFYIPEINQGAATYR